MTTGGATDGPLVSILVPSFNQGRFLPATLDSILAQDHRPLEIIVMDGGSTDETVDVLREYSAHHPEITWRSEPDDGPADAVNKCLAAAQGVYAGIQSSDDVYRPGAIAEGIAELEADPGLGLVCGDADIIDAEGNFTVMVPNRVPFTYARFLARTLFIHQSSTFFRLDLAKEVGGWRREYFCADTDMWLRMMFRSRVKAVSRVWSGRRLHGVQRDQEAQAMWDDWARMIADSPDVRRLGWRDRRAAAAGRRMMAIYYNPTGRSLFRTMQAWLAILTYPPSFWGVWPRSALIPRFGLRTRLAAAVGRAE